MLAPGHEPQNKSANRQPSTTGTAATGNNALCRCLFGLHSQKVLEFSSLIPSLAFDRSFYFQCLGVLLKHEVIPRGVIFLLLQLLLVGSLRLLHLRIEDVLAVFGGQALEVVRDWPANGEKVNENARAPTQQPKKKC